MPVARFLFVQVSECEEVETRIAVAASRVDCKKDWPGNQRTKERDSRADTNESQEEVCIERLVLERVGIWDLPEGAEPVEEACWKSWGSLSVTLLAMCENLCDQNYLLLAQGTEIGSWSIETTLGAAQNQEDGEVDKSNQQSWNEGGNETRERSIFRVVSFDVVLPLLLLFSCLRIKLPLDEV